MDQGLGLKNTHPVDDLASSSDVRIARGNSGHVYESEETEGAFILTVHLKGYRKEHVKIDPSEDGTRLSIFLEKPLIKKKKVFRIPDGVDSNEIKAKFVELESTLRIEMPKVKKGIVGDRVEEWKDEEEDKNDGEEVIEDGDSKDKINEDRHGEVENDKSTAAPQPATENKEVDKREMGKGKDVGGKSTPEKKPAATEKSNPLRTPLIIVGSALMVSIVLLAINRIRNRKKR